MVIVISSFTLWSGLRRFSEEYEELVPFRFVGLVNLIATFFVVMLFEINY